MARAELKLLAALPADWQAEAQKMSSRFHLDPAGWFQPGHQASISSWLPTRCGASAGSRSATRAGSAISDREIDPLGVVLKGGVWYVVARADEKLRTFRLSSILALVVTNQTFERPAGFDLPAYWAASTSQFEKDVYAGIARVRASEKGRSRLRSISATVKQAVEQARIVPDAEGWAVLSIPIEEVGWASREMIRIGAEIEVLEPPELRDRVAEEARKMAGYHAARIPIWSRDQTAKVSQLLLITLPGCGDDAAHLVGVGEGELVFALLRRAAHAHVRVAERHAAGNGARGEKCSSSTPPSRATRAMLASLSAPQAMILMRPAAASTVWRRMASPSSAVSRWPEVSTRATPQRTSASTASRKSAVMSKARWQVTGSEPRGGDDRAHARLVDAAVG